MIEQVISFETAKLAKEKGLTELHSDHTYCIGFKDIPEDRNLSPKIERNSVKGQFHLALAPTQSLLQKWLREVHNINLCLQPLYGGDKIGGKQTGWLCYTPWQDSKLNDLLSISLSRYTYEEALEEGLIEGLKLL